MRYAKSFLVAFALTVAVAVGTRPAAAAQGPSDSSIIFFDENGDAELIVIIETESEIII